MAIVNRLLGVLVITTRSPLRIRWERSGQASTRELPVSAM
jgi:hypothetical protein